MFYEISCNILNNRIEVNGQGFLLGELTEDILNISPEEFHQIDAHCSRLEELDGWRTPENLFEMRMEMGMLRPMFLKRKLFRVLAHTEPEANVYEAVEHVPHWSEQFEYLIPASRREKNIDMEQDIIAESKQYQEMVHDIYAFNQFAFHFIDSHITRLKKMSSSAYAAALHDYLFSPASLDMIRVSTRPERIYQTNNPFEVQFVPRAVTGEDGEYHIYECYRIKSLQGFLKLDFYRALMAGHVIRKCKNCGMYFLLTRGYQTLYCDRPLPDNPSLNCRNRGAKLIAKEKSKNHPVHQSYLRAYKRVDADCRRGNISAEDRDLARTRLADIRDKAISGRFRDAQAEALMQSSALYRNLGIVRKRKTP